jgi:endoglucanase
MYKIYSLVFLIILSCHVAADEECQVNKGINLAGPEFGRKIPGRMHFDYTFPSQKHLIYYKNIGFDYVRLPIKWERIQPSLFSALDPGYLKAIKTFLTQAKEQEMAVLLDLHNYGKYSKSIVGTVAVPYEAFQDFWYKIALELESYEALYGYGLMNEPHGTGGKWFTAAQYGIDGIRQADKHSMIMVAGESWSNSHRWTEVNPDYPFVADPENKIVYEAHIYFDKNFSGIYADPDDIYPATNVHMRLRSFTNWLAKHKQKGIIGEWGVPSNSVEWLGVVDELYNLAEQHCLDTYYWNGGPWTENYLLSLEPKKSETKILTQFLFERFQKNTD